MAVASTKVKGAAAFHYHKTLVVMLLLMAFTCAFLSKLSSRISVRSSLHLRRTTQVVVHRPQQQETGISALESRIAAVNSPRMDVEGLEGERAQSHPFDDWKEPAKKYIVYQPSGGFTNQRILLEKALYLAHRYGATLMLPPVCKHTSYYKQYNLQPLENCSDMLDIFDESLMEQFAAVKSIARHFTLEEFVQRYSEFVFGDWINLPILERKIPMTVMDKLFDYGDVLYLSSKTLWNFVRLTARMRAHAFKFVRFRPELIHLAREVGMKLFNGQSYASVHIRFREAKKFTGTSLGDPRSFLGRLDTAGGKRAFPNLYVATVPNKQSKPFFRPFKTSAYNVLFSDAIIHLPEVEAYLSSVPVSMRESMLGILESLLCSRSTKFLGTGFSSFSQYIRLMRSQRWQIVDTMLLATNDTFIGPEGINSKEIMSAFTSAADQRNPEVEDELQLLSTKTPCRDPLQAC